MKGISMLIYSTNAGVRILRHALFWIVDILFYLSVVSNNGETDLANLTAILIRIVPIILTTYFILYYLLPIYSKRNDQGELIIWLLLILIFMGGSVRILNIHVIEPLTGIGSSNSDLLDIPNLVRNIFSAMSVVCMAITIKLLKNKTLLQQQNENLATAKKLAELNFLKAQMQPHFLFNVLNTLYSETIQESGKAQQVILHLSNLLRFILDECDKPLIALRNEIHVIKDFVELEKLRHGERLHIELNVQEDVDQSMNISPLIFLPFVENSFKHTLTNNTGNIHISIKISKNCEQLMLSVENNFPIPLKPADYHHPKGNTNIKHQLDLLYENAYSLNTYEEQEKYRVELSIPLTQTFDYV